VSKVIKGIIGEIRNIDDSEGALRNFSFSLSLLSILIGGVRFWYLGYAFDSFTTYLSVLSLSFAAIGVIYPKLLAPIYLVWMSLAVALGFVVSRVLLIILFYVLITPVSFAKRLFGKNMYEKRGQSDTYWIQKESREGARKRYENPY
jgi:hypothetical protein